MPRKVIVILTGMTVRATPSLICYTWRAVRTDIFWGRRPPPERPLQVEQVIFHPRQVFLQSLLAEAELERWREPAAPPGREAALELALLPLMRHTLEMRPLLEAALPVTERLEPDLRGPTRAAMLCLGYGELHSPTDRAWAREELLHMPVVGQELFEDLIRDGLERGLEKGRAEGELRRAQQVVLEAFAARFEDPPAALRDAVAQTGDLEQLSRWHREVVRAASSAAALAAVLPRP